MLYTIKGRSGLANSFGTVRRAGRDTQAEANAMRPTMTIKLTPIKMIQRISSPLVVSVSDEAQQSGSKDSIKISI